jgi:transcription termination/antitermination protein NusA
MKITYDANSMKLMTLFENLTGAKVKDCFENKGAMIFVVEEGDIGKALGKRASNVKRIEAMLNKRIRIIEFSQDILRFARNVIMPNKARDIVYEEGIITIVPEDNQSRGFLIGRAAEILRNNESIMQRYFPEVKEMKVV